MSDEKLVSLTVRVPEVYADKFRSNATELNLSQGSYLINLIENNTLSKDISIPKHEQSNLIGLLLSYKNAYNDKSIESKVFEFEGELLYMLPMAREPYLFSRLIFKRLFSLPAKYSVNYDPYTQLTIKQQQIQTTYQFAVYRRFKDDKFIVYELFSASENNIANVVKTRCHLCDNLQGVVNAVSQFASRREIEQIEYALADKISDDSELYRYL